MTPPYPLDYGLAAVLCSICGRTLVPRHYTAGSAEVPLTAWVCQQCDLIPDPRQPA